MANTKSAEKRVRQTATRTLRNKAMKTRVKNARKSVLSALSAGDAKLVAAKMNEFASVADRAANSGVIHKNTSNRLKKRLAHAVAKGTKGSAK